MHIYDVVVKLVLEHGLNNLCETASKLIQNHVLSLDRVLGLPLSLLSLGQQTATYSFHHSRGYYWFRPSEYTYTLNMRNNPIALVPTAHCIYTLYQWSRESGTWLLQKHNIVSRPQHVLLSTVLSHKLKGKTATQNLLLYYLIKKGLVLS